MAYRPPIYECKEIVDIRYGKIGEYKMPERIYIDSVYRKSGSMEWMYYVNSEQKDGFTYMSESLIFKNQSSKTAKCYDHPIVKGLYNNGFRFVANGGISTLKPLIDTLVGIYEIEKVISIPSIFPDGQQAKHKKQRGVWIKYNNTIQQLPNNNIDIEYTIYK